MYQYTNIFGAFSRARPPRKISKKKIIDPRFHGLPAAAGFFFGRILRACICVLGLQLYVA